LSTDGPLRRPFRPANIACLDDVWAIAEPSLAPHGLRHTAASLAIKAGAKVKAVQWMLGHASAAMTLDRYADLFTDDLNDVLDRLDTLRGPHPADELRTSCELRPRRRAHPSPRRRQVRGSNEWRRGESTP
jgi:hypothetical protein